MAQGAPGLPDLEFIGDGDLNLYVYPSIADYTDARPLDPTWQRLESSVRETDDVVRSCPPNSPSGDGALIYFSPRLARLGRRRADAPGDRRARQDAAPLHRLQGSAARRDRTRGQHVGRRVPAADLDHAAGRPGHHARRQQHHDRGAALRQADDRAAAVLGPVRQRPAGRTNSGLGVRLDTYRSPTTSCTARSTGCSATPRCARAWPTPARRSGPPTACGWPPTRSRSWAPNTDRERSAAPDDDPDQPGDRRSHRGHRRTRLSDDVAAVVAHARAAFDEWREATPAQRAAVLLRVADLVEANAEVLTALEVEETGKPAPVVRDGEIPFAVDNLRFFAGAARSLDGTGAGTLSAGYTSLLVRRPVGVVGSIAPWNFPLVMAIWKIGPGGRGRQRRGHQAGAADAAHDDGAGSAVRRSGRPARPGHRDHRRCRGRFGAGRRSGRRHGQRHRVDAYRPRGDARRRSVGSSASTWSWAARHRRSCSPMPTWTRWPPASRWAPPTTPGRTAPRPPASTSSDRAYDDAVEALVAADVAGSDPATRGRPTPTSVRSSRPSTATACTASSRRAVADGARVLTGGGRPATARLLLPADRHRRCRPAQRDRPGRGVRAGGRGAAVRRRGRRRSRSPTTRSTVSPPRSGPATWPGRCGSRTGSMSA